MTGKNEKEMTVTVEKTIEPLGNKQKKSHFWQHTWDIFMYDYQHIIHNWVAVVIVIAIAILPSLYAWFNIYAMWDPYSNTGNIRVAVVNEDKGTTLLNTPLNLGEQVITNLKSNTKMGWQFGDSGEEALKKLRKGKVFAVIIIPKNFSQKMGTVLDKDPQYPTLQYYENQKLNPVAPKLTSTGVSTVQKTINQEFIGEVAQVVFTELNKAGNFIDKNASDLAMYRGLIKKLNDNFPTIRKDVDQLVTIGNHSDQALARLQNDIPLVQDILGISLDFTGDLQTQYQDLQARINDSTTILDNNLSLVKSMLASVSSVSSDMYRESKSNTIEGLGDALDIIGDTRSSLVSLKDLLNDLQKSGHDISEDSKTSTNEMITQLDHLSSILKQVKNGNYKTEDIENLLKSANSSLDSAQNALSILDSVLTDDLEPLISLSLDSLDNLQDVLQDGLSNASGVMDTTITQLEANKKVLSDLLTVANKLPVHNVLVKQITQSIHQINTIEDYITSLRNSNNATASQVRKLGNYIINLKLDLNNLNNTFDNQLMDELNNTMNSATAVNNRLMSLLDFNDKDLNAIVDSSIKNVDAMKPMLTKYLDVVNCLQDSHMTDKSKERIGNLITKLDKYRNKLTDAKKNLQNESELQGIIQDLNTLNAQMESDITTISDDYNAVVKPRLNTFLDRAVVLNEDIGSLLRDTNESLDEFNTIVNDVRKHESTALADLETFNKEKMPKLEQSVHKLNEVFEYLDSHVDMNQIMSILSNSPTKEKDFLSEAVKVKTHAIYKMPTYGSAIAPFFTILCLWVGVTIAGALLSVKTRAKGPFTSRETFVGKFFLFAAIALLQGLIVSLGNIFIVKTHIVHTVTYTLIAMYASVVFTMFVYTLVSLFDNVGKALSIILLVLQIGAAGGTFPVEVTPKFFQMLNPIIPFTYAIGAMREAAGGIVASNLIFDLAILSLYFIIPLIVGLLFKPSINRFLGKFKKKWHEANISE